MRYLGLDLGGTNVKAAVIDVDGDTRSIVATTRTATGADRGPAAVAATTMNAPRTPAITFAVLRSNIR